MQAITSFIVKRKNLLVRVGAVVLPVVVLLALVAPTVFAMNTYVITDGDQVKIYTTYATDPVSILDRAGVHLGEEDTYTTHPGDGVSEITVQRLQNITVHYRGESHRVSSYGETLEMLLNRLEITEGEYAVSVPLETETYDGMEVAVDSIVKMQQSYTVDIPYEVVECYDPTLPKGEKVVRVAGVAGQKAMTANVEYVNSVEKSREVLSQTVLQEPVNQIVAVGTGEQVGAKTGAPAIGNGVIVTASGEVLTYTHSEQFKTTAYSHMDAGCDMITATGTTVRVGTVAVDPKVIPYGTRMFIVCNDGSYVYGTATAEDCGGGIKGNEIDLYMPTRSECFQYGVRRCTVYFLD